MSMKLYDTDYIIIDSKTKQPIESLGICYNEESKAAVGTLETGWEWVSMTKLPKELQEKAIEELKNETLSQ